MMYIEMLPPIAMCEISGTPIEQNGKPWEVTMEDFIHGRLVDKSVVSSTERLFASVDMRDALRELGASTDAKYLALETKHWEYLRDATKDPHAETGYNHIIGHNLIPFMKAIINASDKKPDDFDGVSDKDVSQDN